MDKKKGIVLAVIVVLVVLIGIILFVYLGGDNENENDTNIKDNGKETLEDENTTDEEENDESTTDNQSGNTNHGSDKENENESTLPSVPHESVVDEKYDLALIAVVEAEKSLLQSDVDYAFALVNELEDGDLKAGLISRIQAVENMIRAILAVQTAEETLLQEDVTIAKTLIGTLVDSNHKLELLNRVFTVEHVIDVTLLVQELQGKVENAFDISSFQAAKAFRENVVGEVEALGESARKDELLSTLDSLSLILDDTQKPVIEGIMNGAIINDTSVIKITDANEVTIWLNGKEAELEDLTQNLLVDGDYVLIVRDRAFNSSEEITFTVDKTAPQVEGLDGVYVVNKETEITIFDEHLTSVILNDTPQTFHDNRFTYTLTANGTYHFIVTDSSYNVTEFTVLMDTNISKIVLIDSNEAFMDAIANQDDNQYWIIKEGNYLLRKEELENSFLAITKNNLKVMGEGNVTIQMNSELIDEDSSFITITGNNVVLDHLTLVGKNEVSNVIEISGNNALLSDITINPDTLDSTDFAGSIDISGNNIVTNLENVTLNKGRISLDKLDSTSQLILNNVLIDLAGSSEEMLLAFTNPNGATIEAKNFTVTASDAIASVLNQFIASLPNGTKLILDDGEYDVGTLTVQNQIELEGTSSNTVLKVGGDALNQASIDISNVGAIRNLKILSSNHDVTVLKVSGDSSNFDYTISNVEISGGKIGIDINGVANAVIDFVIVHDTSEEAILVASSKVIITNSNLSVSDGNMAVGILYDASDPDLYPSPAQVVIGTGNKIENGLSVENPDDENDFIFEDGLLWQEVYDGNLKKYYL